MGTQILLVGQGLFHDGLICLLADFPAAEVVGQAKSWSEARAMIEQCHPDAVIVDQADPELFKEEHIPVLNVGIVIYLTLTDNRMVVHDRHQLMEPTMDDLLKALRITENRDGDDAA
jgi:hypothetical protein